MKKENLYKTPFSKVYPYYIKKAENKNRTKDEVDEIICWLTGYNESELQFHLDNNTEIETFFNGAKNANPSRFLIKGVVCKVRVEEIEDPLMREIRYLDKLIDELSKGKSMDKILRSN